MAASFNTKRSRIKRSLPRPCKACGQEFRPKNAKAKYCGSACKQAQHRQKTQEPEIVTRATHIAPVTIRSKSFNNINAVSGHFCKPRVAPMSGWQIEAGELLFVPMADTAPFSIKERRRFGHGHHMRLVGIGAEGDGDIDDLDVAPNTSARLSARTAVLA